VRPATVHALAQAIRHARGLVATLDKWLAATPPAAVADELTLAVGVLRDALGHSSTALGRPRSSTAPAPGASTDHPGSARPGRPINRIPWGPG
jgi:hypothetical protein